MSFTCAHCGSAFLRAPRDGRCPGCGQVTGAAGTGSPPSSTERLYVAAGRISATGYGLLVTSVAVVLARQGARDDEREE